MTSTAFGALVCLVAVAQQALTREWVDSTGKYTFQGDLIGFSADTVVLKKANNDLVMVPIAKLSKKDQDYLQSKEASAVSQRTADQLQTWTMRNGLMVIGRVVEYGRREITVQRRRGKTYVNDLAFASLPEVKRRILMRVVAHFEKTEIDDEKQFESWVVKLKGQPRTFTCEGVVLELENGDEYGVPFFLFSNADLKVLQPGWQQWLAADTAAQKQEQIYQQKEQEAFLLRTAAAAYQRDRQMDQQIKRLELDMLASASGLTDLWEVQLFPAPGVAAYPRTVVVPGQNSDQAKVLAMQRYPGYVAGLVARANRVVR
jgi:hypothetical protein